MIRLICPVCSSIYNDNDWFCADDIIIQNGPCSLKCVLSYKILFPTTKTINYFIVVTKNLYNKIIKIIKY